MPPLLRILTLLLLTGISLPHATSQTFPLVFGIKRTPDTQACDLPMIYFEPGTIQMAAGYDLELRYLAHIMKKYRRMQIRIKPDLVPSPGNVPDRLLLEERLSYIVAYMESEYDIKRNRFIRDDYSEISRGYAAPVAPPPPLVKRRIVCECVWD